MNQTWPDTVFQGLGIACWKMEGDTPGAIVWPLDGESIYNPNTGGGWIIQPVEPKLNLNQTCPQGFAVGVEYIYQFPNCDTVGHDSQMPGPYTWDRLAWWSEGYYNWMIRCFIDDEGNAMVETTTLGSLRALYR